MVALARLVVVKWIEGPDGTELRPSLVVGVAVRYTEGIIGESQVLLA